MDGHYQSRMIFCEIDKVEKVKVNFVVKHHEYIEQATTLKPIIYFYPEQEMDLSVTYYDPSKLITTYPKYNDGWNIHLKEDGKVILFTHKRTLLGYLVKNAEAGYNLDDNLVVTYNESVIYDETDKDIDIVKVTYHGKEISNMEVIDL